MTELEDAIARFSERCQIELAGRSIARLASLVTTLQETAVGLGLISETDRSAVLQRHVLDCLRAAALFERADTRALDLGPGAGLPGLVLAIALPHCSFYLVDPRRRSIGFLELAVDRLALENVSLFLGRAEEIDKRDMDVVTARAFGPMERSWECAFPLLRPGGRLVYFAGRRLKDPQGAAASIDRPERPASVQAAPVVESSAPLVIMSRRGGGC